MRDIERRLGVARSSVSLWVREIELTDHQQEELNARGVSARSRGISVYYRARRRTFQDEGRALARRAESLHAAGCMLFWAEGSRQRNSVHLTNSDPAMLASSWLPAPLFRASGRVRPRLVQPLRRPRRTAAGDRERLARLASAAAVTYDEVDDQQVLARQQAHTNEQAALRHLPRDGLQHTDRPAPLRRDPGVRRVRAPGVARLA